MFDPLYAAFWTDTAWHFQLIFDYGEHAEVAPNVDGTGTWAVRQDPFSTYRPGFENRTCAAVPTDPHVS